MACVACGWIYDGESPTPLPPTHPGCVQLNVDAVGSARFATNNRLRFVVFQSSRFPQLASRCRLYIGSALFMIVQPFLRVACYAVVMYDCCTYRFNCVPFLLSFFFLCVCVCNGENGSGVIVLSLYDIGENWGDVIVLSLYDMGKNGSDVIFSLYDIGENGSDVTRSSSPA